MRLVYEYDGTDVVIEPVKRQTVNDLLATAEDIAVAHDTALEEINIRFVDGDIVFVGTPPELVDDEKAEWMLVMRL